MRFSLVIISIFLLSTSFVIAQNADSVFTESKADSVTVYLSADDSLLTNKKDRYLSDTLLSVHSSPYDSFHEFVSNNEIKFSDYRTASELLQNHSFAYYRNSGFMGIPSELNLYGKGFNEISYTGMNSMLNDRATNTFDLHLVQTELVDSIELIPLARGFLYGGWNPVSLNFIQKEIRSRAPKSRIKYYEGSYGESLIDAQFFLLPYKKLNLYFDVTNRTSGERYLNTSFGIWQIKTGALLYLTDNLTLYSDYYYHLGNISINGGIDVKRIGTSDVDATMYNERLAPVRFNNQYNRKHVNRLTGGVRGKLFDQNYSEVTVYYISTLDEFRNNENDAINRVMNDYAEKTSGVFVRQKLETSYLNIDINATIENSQFDNYYGRETFFYNSKQSYSAGGLLSLKLIDTTIIPSFFGRVFRYGSKTGVGLGGDLRVRLSDKIYLYGGLSAMTNSSIYNSINDNNSKLINSEAGFNYSGSILNVRLNVFNSKYDNKFINYYTQVDSNDSYSGLAYPLSNQFGASLYTQFTYSKFMIESKIFSIISNIEGANFSTQPDFILNAGFFYSDILFDNNLKLKAGLTFEMTGKQDYFTYNYERLDVMFVRNKHAIPNAFTLNFSAQGEIQESAIIYFSWENLLDNKYYITPYYPMPVRGIRFGIAWNFIN